MGILSALKMIFSSPKKVIRMLMNNTNQIQTINMFWMTNEMSSMPLLFRSGSILTNFLKHLFCFNITKSVLFLSILQNIKKSVTEFVLVVHVTLVKPTAMQKLDGMSIIIQLKDQNHRNIFETILTTVLHGLFQMLQKMLKPGRI